MTEARSHRVLAKAAFVFWQLPLRFEAESQSQRPLLAQHGYSGQWPLVSSRFEYFQSFGIRSDSQCPLLVSTSVTFNTQSC